MDIARTPDSTVFPIGAGSVNSLVGEMLTLVDASISDPTQRKAVKDLATQKIWNWWNNQRPMHEYSITYYRMGENEEDFVGYDSRKRIV